MGNQPWTLVPAGRGATGRLALLILQVGLAARAAATGSAHYATSSVHAPAGPCDLTGVWNALGQTGAGGTKLVNVTQKFGSSALSLRWWLPDPSGGTTGTLDQNTHKVVMKNGFEAVASISKYPVGQHKDCTTLSFTKPAGAVWCQVGFCPSGPSPPPPGPPLPPGDKNSSCFTIPRAQTPPLCPPVPSGGGVSQPMLMVEVPGAAAAGAIYPNNKPASYELVRGTGAGWVVMLSGGGWRFMSNTTDAADADAPLRRTAAPPLLPDAPLSADGSALPMGQERSAEGGCYNNCDGIMSPDPTQNPLFHTWNKVFVPISGTSFTGNRDSLKPYPVRGARILAAVIGHMQSEYGMSGATDVVLTGGSSGGMAVYLTCDRVAAMVAAANTSTRFSCLPDAGFFMDHPSMSGAPSTSPKFLSSFYAWNSSGGTNQDCLAHYTKLGTPEQCIFSENVLPFIKSKIFVLQNLYDSWQLNNILRVKCTSYGKDLSGCNANDMKPIQAYGATMRTRLAAGLSANPTHGIFAPSCIAHCQNVENEHPAALWHWPRRWAIGSGASAKTPQQLHTSWYKKVVLGGTGGGSDGGVTQLVQACEWGCNPLCPYYT